MFKILGRDYWFRPVVRYNVYVVHWCICSLIRYSCWIFNSFRPMAHCVVTYLTFRKLGHIINNGSLWSFKHDKFYFVSCYLRKQKTLIFNNSNSINYFRTFWIKWGLTPHSTKDDSRYIMVFIDDYSRLTWMYMLDNWFELPKLYIHFSSMIITQTLFLFDKGVEYNSSKFSRTLRLNGTIIHRSYSGTSQQMVDLNVNLVTSWGVYMSYS